MTGPRIQPPDIRRPGVRPVARPVGRFAAPGRDGLLDFAEGLEQLTGQGTELVNLLQERSRQRDLESAKLTAEDLRGIALTFKEAVAAGKLDPNQNPFFVKSLNTLLGRNAADDFASQFQATVTKDLADSTDPSELEDLYVKQRAEYIENLGEAGSDFMLGFNPRTEAHRNNIQQQFNRQTSSRFLQARKDAVGVELRGLLENGLDDGTDPEVIGQALDISIKDQIREGGIDGRTASQLALATIIEEAEDRLDLTILDIASLVPGGTPGSNIAATQESQRELRVARERITRKIEQNKRVSDAADENERAEVRRAVFSELSKELRESDNPRNVNLAPFQARLEAVGLGELNDNMNAYRNNFIANDRPDNPDLVRDLIARVYDKKPGDSGFVDMETLFSHSGSLSNQDIFQVESRIARRDQLFSGSLSAVERRKESQFKEQRSALRRQMGVDELGLASEALQEAAVKGQAELEFRWREWQDTEEGQAAGWKENLAFLADNRNDIVDNMRTLLEVDVPEPPVPGLDVTPEGREEQRLESLEIRWRRKPIMSKNGLALLEGWIRVGPERLPDAITDYLDDNGVEPHEVGEFIAVQRQLLSN